MRKFLTISLICLLAGQSANAMLDIYSDMTIQAGQIFNGINVYDTFPNHTTVTMTGGSVDHLFAWDESIINISGGSAGINANNHATVNVSNSANLYSASAGSFGIFNVYGGTIHQLYSGGSSTITVYGGTINTLGADDSSVINLMGGLIPYLNSGPPATVNVFGHGLMKTSTGGLYNDGQVTGFWQDGSPFTINLSGPYTYSAVNLIPEPATFLLFGIGTFLLRKTERRMQKSE